MSASRSARAPRLLSTLIVGVLATSLAVVPQGTASASSSTMVGGYSSDPAWFDHHIGAREIYRGFNKGLPTDWAWSGFATRPAIVDYSFDMLASSVGSNRSRIRAFVATTPKNIIMTWSHEPELRTNPAAFRSATRIVADIVHAQNRADGGHRRYQIVLLGWTFNPRSPGSPLRWWPGRDKAGRNYADIVSVDAYSDPRGPNVHGGYTNGVNWRSAAQMFDPVIAFARHTGARWSVSELGYLEDSTDPLHKARAITAAVAYAIAHHAVAVEYWNGDGPRADWRLLHSLPATAAFRRAVAAG